ncbi:Succinate-semialdehyde dehydrogenase (NADP+) [Tolypocladium capitatum]|uniref:Succinate-semialdehyde dehydrogenase (NADP+) n=1 Tax=Tolypocladium capitatum TaxID=45235 RepID=A0A2K3QAX0_9HYPO|nr:Succinate-semialdehyde dehydrogenase (NADP+) [Tolypocladium capitatum]
MRIMDEEIFGPVATEEEAIAAANNRKVGLASCLFAELSESEALHSCMVAVNTGVISDAAAPFGGVKQPGLGREGSRYGVDDHEQLKTVVTGNVSQAASFQGIGRDGAYAARADDQNPALGHGMVLCL